MDGSSEAWRQHFASFQGMTSTGVSSFLQQEPLGNWTWPISLPRAPGRSFTSSVWLVTCFCTLTGSCLKAYNKAWVTVGPTILSQVFVTDTLSGYLNIWALTGPHDMSALWTRKQAKQKKKRTCKLVSGIVWGKEMEGALEPNSRFLSQDYSQLLFFGVTWDRG